jgi:glycosyltransferase involved in cell wall biosynthesis
VNLKRMLRPRAGQLAMYPPRPVNLPTVGQVATSGPMVKISIVVPSFNQGQFIGATLQSIIDQNYPNLELIVVDGGSKDETVAVINQYAAHIDWWVSEPDSGQTAAINKGFARSSGEIMAWINSDDLAAPGALTRVAAWFAAHPETHVVYGDRLLIDENGDEVSRWILPPHSRRVLDWADFIPQETLYWRRSAWDVVGARLDESFRFAMDWDFLLRLSSKQVNFEHLPFFLGMFRVHRNQKTSSQMTSVGQQEMQILRRRALGYAPTRWQLIMNTIPFLLRTRLLEIGRLLR